MDRLHIVLVVLLGLVSCSLDWISGSVLAVTVRPGENVTLYCDCKRSTGEYIVWYRNCSHENQPSLVLEVSTRDFYMNRGTDFLRILPRFQFVRNYSSDSFDLLIMNITDSDEGLYYCGTRQTILEDRGKIIEKDVYRYGNMTTGINVHSRLRDCSGCSSIPECGVSWATVFPVFTIYSSFLCFILFYFFCQKIDKEPQILQERPGDTRGQTRWNLDEDVCSTRVLFRAWDGKTHQ